MSRPVVQLQAAALLWAALYVASPAHAAAYRVGIGAGCTHGSLQSAINTARSGDSVLVNQGMAASAQQLSIIGKSLTIVGGYTDCSDTHVDGNDRTYVSGYQGAPASVFTIRGPGSVVLSNLNIQAGDPLVGGDGGGINYVASSVAGSDNSLTLAETNVQYNTGRKGGGLYFGANTSSTSARLYLLDGAFFFSNKASNGGGIYLDGNVQLQAAGERVLFTFNEAQFDGGALFANAGSVVDIGVAGYPDWSTFDYNVAQRNGGAIAVMAAAANRPLADLRLYSTNAERPMRVNSNRAGVAGGAIAVYGVPDSTLASARICTQGITIAGNIAGGAAIIQADGAAAVDVGTCDSTIQPAVTRCGADDYCNLIASNHDNLGAPVPPSSLPSSLFDVSRAAQLRLHRVTLRGNGADLGFRVTSSSPSARSGLSIADSVLRANEVWSDDHAALVSVLGSDVVVTRSTMTDNTYSNSSSRQSIFQFGSDVRGEIAQSIIYEPYQTFIEAADFAPMVVLRDLLLSHVPEHLGHIPSIIEGSPRFVDTSNLSADYRLTAQSPAIDFSSSSDSALDLDLNPRGVDSAGVPNREGPFDLGAYEFQGQ